MHFAADTSPEECNYSETLATAALSEQEGLQGKAIAGKSPGIGAIVIRNSGDSFKFNLDCLQFNF
jgi:hypothetical protein